MPAAEAALGALRVGDAGAAGRAGGLQQQAGRYARLRGQGYPGISNSKPKCSMPHGQTDGRGRAGACTRAGVNTAKIGRPRTAGARASAHTPSPARSAAASSAQTRTQSCCVRPPLCRMPAWSRIRHGEVAKCTSRLHAPPPQASCSLRHCVLTPGTACAASLAAAACVGTRTKSGEEPGSVEEAAPRPAGRLA